MNRIHLSKSKYCKAVQCEKILWLTEYKPIPKDEDDKAVFKKGRQVGELAKGLFGDYEDVPYDEDNDFRIERTRELLNGKPNIICEASFGYDNNFCSVDILKNDLDGVEIYEVKSSTKVKDIYFDDVAYQYFVLSNLGLNVKRAAVVYINNEYVRGHELDIKQLFTIEDITDDVRQKQDEIRANVDMINEYMVMYGEDNEPEKELGIHCFNPYSCDYWDYCTRDLPKPNVFDIRGGMWISTKFKKYHEGKVSFEDLADEDLNPKYLEQIHFELNDPEPKIEKDAIKEVLGKLKYPLYFIDYETCNLAVPELEGTRPYQQIPFQYSLHIIRGEGASVEHKEFLAEVNDENMIRSFAESMIGNMPEDGSVIVYNKSFETGRNREIAKMYPDLADEMERFNANVVDFMKPFKDRDYYMKEMKGSYSIKYVLPALYPDEPKLNYGNLESIHNGSEASEAFLKMKDQTPDEQEMTRKNLLKYCELDTLAMVKIWEKFKEVTK